MRKFNIITLSIVLTLLATIATGVNLQSKAKKAADHLGLESKGFLCPDIGWVTTPAGEPTPTYTVKWCYSGSKCITANDFVYVSVKSREAYIQCRPETQKILQFAFGLAVNVVGVLNAGGWAAMAAQALKTGLKQGLKYGSQQLQGNAGSDGCYCFAERWTSVETIYATLVSDSGRTFSLEVLPDFLSQVNSENVNQNSLLRILDGSCNSPWDSTLCKYKFVRARKTMSWSDLTDELAWLGDRGTWPNNLFIWNETPPAVQCNARSSPRRQGSISRKWCFNNARSNCNDDIIQFMYQGTAEIKCRPGTSTEIPPIGSMILAAYGLNTDVITGDCVCYPANFDASPATIFVSDESGDSATLRILPDQFWGLMLDTVQSRVKARIDLASTGNWWTNIGNRYKAAQVKYTYDWDEFGDDIAWWGDRNAIPDGLYQLWNYDCGSALFADFDNTRDLTAGNCLYSDADAIRQSDKVQMILHPDGNLCFYQRSSTSAPWQAKWCTATVNKGRAPYRACMQRNGDFALYESNNQMLWSTTTNYYPDCSILKVQSDGWVAVYMSQSEVTHPVWWI